MPTDIDKAYIKYIVYIHTCTHTNTHTHKYSHTHKYMYIYIYIYIYIYKYSLDSCSNEKYNYKSQLLYYIILCNKY